MRIAEAAAQSGLSIDTIRFYERRGLLPNIARGPDGQRRFNGEAIDWLILLSALRQTGMPLKTMARFAACYREGDRTLPQRREILLEHQASLAERRAALDRCATLLAHKLTLYDTLEREQPLAAGET